MRSSRSRWFADYMKCIYYNGDGGNHRYILVKYNIITSPTSRLLSNSCVCLKLLLGLGGRGRKTNSETETKYFMGNDYPCNNNIMLPLMSDNGSDNGSWLDDDSYSVGHPSLQWVICEYFRNWPISLVVFSNVICR